MTRARAIRWLFRFARRLCTDNNGSALIELALALSLVGLPLFFGTIYTGVLVFDNIEIANAAHAGAMYGMQSSTYASDAAGMTAAAQAETPDLANGLVVTPITFYACSAAIDGTQYSTQQDATTACTGGSNHALEFVKVTASYVATPFARIAGMQQSVTVSSVSVMEVEE
jgi:Flp pilus assembly protein TadG